MTSIKVKGKWQIRREWLLPLWCPSYCFWWECGVLYSLHVWILGLDCLYVNMKCPLTSCLRLGSQEAVTERKIPIPITYWGRPLQWNQRTEGSRIRQGKSLGKDEGSDEASPQPTPPEDLGQTWYHRVSWPWGKQVGFVSLPVSHWLQAILTFGTCSLWLRIIFQ